MSEERPDDLLGDVAGRVDTKLEEEGAWFEHAPEDGTLGQQLIPGYRHLLLDGNGNGLRRVMVKSRFTREYQRGERKATARAVRIPGDERIAFNERMVSDLTARYCVSDWDFTNRQGNQIPCELDLVQRILTEPEFRHHKDFIFLAIARLQRDIQEVAEEDEGN